MNKLHTISSMLRNSDVEWVLVYCLFTGLLTHRHVIIAIRADLLKFKIANWSEDKTYVLNGVNSLFL